MKFAALCLVLGVVLVQSGMTSKTQEPIPMSKTEAVTEEPATASSQVMTWCTNMMTSLKNDDYTSFFLLFDDESMVTFNNPLVGVLEYNAHGLTEVKNAVRQMALTAEITETNFEISAVDEAKAICIAQWNSTGHFIQTQNEFTDALSTLITKFGCNGRIISQTLVSTDAQLYLGYSTKAEKAMGKVWWTWFSDPDLVKLTLDSKVFGLISPDVKLTITTMPSFILSNNVYTGHQGLLDARQEMFTKMISPRDLTHLKESKYVILFADDTQVYMSLPTERHEQEAIVERFFHLKFDSNGLLVEVSIAFPNVIRPWDLASQPANLRTTEMIQGQ